MFENNEVINGLGLTPEQLTAINTEGSNILANEKLTIEQSYQGKANENAEGILSGASSYLLKKTGLEMQREKGEKYGDFINRVSDKYFESKENDYNSRLESIKGQEGLKSEYERLKNENDTLLKKYADYDELKSGYDSLKANEEKNQIRFLEASFNSEKPRFPETVNPYEAAAKWEEAKGKILEKWEVADDNGKAILVSKDNKYKTSTIKAELAKDKNLTDLYNNASRGSGARYKKDLVTIDGLENVPVDAKTNAKVRSEYITEHLKSLGLNQNSSDYRNKFAELNVKIVKG